MGRLESLRDRLPSLYRPDDEDVDPEPRPLAPADVVEVLGREDAIPFVARARGDGALGVRLVGSSPGPLRALRLAADAAPGPGWALELHRIRDDESFVPKPALVADVRDGTAVLPGRFAERRFGLVLRRRGLLTLALVGTADALDRASLDAALVMQAHWFAFADRALYDPFFLRGRELHVPPLPPPKPDEPPVLDFPYVLDLGRLASLVSVPPWQTAPTGNGNGAGESVEAYRQRIRRIVTLYADGLGTVDALRRMTEAQLPVDIDAPPERRDRPFALEENAPLVSVRLAVQPPGAPAGLVGPLMHWRVTNDGRAAVAPTLYVQAPTDEERAAASASGAGPVEDARSPLVERFDPQAAELAVGLAYADTIPGGKTLRLRPSFASWLGRDDGVLVAGSGSDPTAPGPWEAATDAPTERVTALLRTDEHALWVAVEAAGTATLWRHDGAEWTKALAGPGMFHCLAEDRTDLLIGSEHGLLRMDRFPDDADPFIAKPVASVGDVAVHAVVRVADGIRWIGAATGLGRLGEDDAFEPFVLRGDAGTEVRALAEDATGALLAGTARGLFLLEPGGGAYWFSGETPSDDDPEWQVLEAATFPSDEEVFLPAVTCVRRTRDGTLWIGTVAGLARYLARSARGPLAFDTQLEAFPDLVPGMVHDLVEDERGLLWICSDRGLFRFDGRDLLQYREGAEAWEQLGRADTLYEEDAAPRERGTWRFVRGDAAWQRFGRELAVPDWVTFSADPRSADEPEVRALGFTDAVEAALLDTWSPEDFSTTGSTPVDPSLLALRCKLPGYGRIVAGGIPAVPRLPAGVSSWRYLSLEPPDLVEPTGLPAWTVEGRLVRGSTPPPDAEPDPGRWDETTPDPDAGEFDEAVFAFPPAARVGFEWAPRRPLAVLARLARRSPQEQVDPTVLDRVFQGLRQVRPAGARVALAVDDDIVRKES